MRVLMISHTCQSRRLGQPKADHLSHLPGIELRVVTPDRWLEYGVWREPQLPTEAAYAFQVERVRWPWSGPAQWYLHWYPKMAQILREFQPDIIDLWEEPWGLVSAHAAWLRNRLCPQAKIVAETEQNIAKNLPPPFESFRAYTLRNADFVVGRSAEAVAHLRARGYKGPAAVVPNAVDESLFRPLNRDECRRALGLSGFVAGYIGRLVEEKGLAELVDALTHCPPDASLLFVGSGAYQADLEQQARQAGIDHRVRFLPERAPEELPAIMNALDALMLPSRTTPRWKEQFGRVIIEAHSCGTPVIGSDSGAIPSVLGQGGLVVPERDAGAIAAAIRTLYDAPEQARRMGQIGRQQVEAQYTWACVARQMHAIYGQTLCSARDTAGEGFSEPEQPNSTPTKAVPV